MTSNSEVREPRHLGAASQACAGVRFALLSQMSSAIRLQGRIKGMRCALFTSAIPQLPPQL
jgi:hypothetical protein